MWFQILGPLKITGDDGAQVSVSQPKRRALLCLLLLRANQPVSGPLLCLQMWGEDPPDGAVHTLATHLSALRRLLPAGRILRGPVGYTLQATSVEVDLLRFRRFVDQGRRAASCGDTAAAGRAFRKALTLWRAPAPSDLPDTPRASAEARGLIEERIAAQDAAFDIWLVLGEHRELVPGLRRLTAAEPLHEHRWAQLMLALYRCGRQADALAAYRDVREILADQVGADPGGALQRMQQRILAADPGLGWEPA